MGGGPFEGWSLRALRRDSGEQLGRRTRTGCQEIVAVEHVVDRDRVDVERWRAEIKDRDPILAAGTAAEPNDETRGLGHDRRDVATAVVLTAPAAGHLLEMTDQLIDPTHALSNTHFSCLSAGDAKRLGVTDVSRG